MKTLILGSRGMLGTDLMQAFGSASEIVGWDLGELDITDAGRCHGEIGKAGPDVIVCSAALTAVDYCEAHEEEAFLLNAQGVGNVAAASASIGALLVHYSTDYVFDGRKKDAYTEEDPANPLSVYGRSKWRGEELVRLRCPDHLILRTSWLFGRNGKNFIRTMLDAARAGRQLRVVNDQRGSPTYTRDLAGATVRMVAAGCRGIYHVTNGGSCTWHELALRALEFAGLGKVPVAPISTAEYPVPAPRPANSVLANAKLEREGFQTLRPWPAAVREYLEEIGLSG
jgi:dTDP-4-dehydrorhamnose reductase